MKKILIASILVLMLFPTAMAASVSYQTGLHQAKTNVNVRILPRANSARINHLHKGETVNVKRVVGGWCEIDLKKYKHAYVNCSLLEAGSTGAVVAQTPAISKYADFIGVAVGKTEQGNWTLGSNDAKVTMEEYGDLECPFCAAYFTTTFPQIFQNYILPGKVKYVYHDFPLSFHAQSENAAVASLCAGEQDQFWLMHTSVLINRDTWSVTEGLSAFDGLAKDMGLKMADFDACMVGNAFKAQIDADYAAGLLKGVNGTPSFFVNGEAIMGAVPYETFAAAIDAALKGK